MQSNRASGMKRVLVRYCSPPKVKKQSKQMRPNGLDEGHREEDKEGRRIGLKRRKKESLTLNLKLKFTWPLSYNGISFSNLPFYLS